MKFRDFRSKVALRLRPGTRYPDLEAIDSKTQPQRGSTLMQLPLEIRNAIFQELWNDAGVSQHIVLQDNRRYLRARCVTDHTRPDSLMDECARFNTSCIEDPLIWRRLMSSWGPCWKCEELYQSTKQTPWSPFLSMMLACRQLYLECRASICNTLTFVMHDLETLNNFTVSHPSPLLNDIKHLHLAIRLPIRWEKYMSPEAHVILSRWRDCCQALNRAQNLVLVNLWLDTSEPSWRVLLTTVQGNVNPFAFGERLAGVLTVDIPVNPDRPEVWQAVANVEPRFTIRPRGWPAFKAETASTTPNRIFRLEDNEEPGVLKNQTMRGTYIRHRPPRHLR